MLIKMSFLELLCMKYLKQISRQSNIYHEHILKQFKI